MLPTFVSAHVKWFAEPKKIIPPYKLSDPKIIFGIIIALFVILFGIFLEKKLNAPEKLRNFAEKYTPNILSIVSIGFGIAFLLFSYNGFIFSPNLPALDLIGEIMLILQVVIGTMFLFGIYSRFAGILLILLFIIGGSHFGILPMFEALEIFSFGIFAIIVGRPKWKLLDTEFLKSSFQKISEYALPILRVGTGVNLIILGFTEKILTPSLTDNFLTNYNWNFMQLIGFENFTNYYFAFSAGMSEILFGVFFILGLVTRTTTIALAIFLLSTLVLLGPIELIGHLPHFSIAVALIVLGSGTRFVLFRK